MTSRLRWSAAQLWRRRRTACAVLVVTVAAAGYWVTLTPREYRAVAWVSTGQSRAARTGTLAVLARTRPVLREVSEQLNGRRSIARLHGEVDATARPGTELVRIAVTDTDPVLARRVANTVARALPRHAPGGDTVPVTLVAPATTPRAPIAPNVAAVALIALALGSLLALLAALIHSVVARRVESGQDVAELTGLPVLADLAVPPDADALPGPVTAPFRRLRVALEFAGGRQPARTVVIAPAVAATAASWATVNLAAALAQLERRVLIVDADPGDRARHPLLPGKGDGLLDVLAGLVSLEDAIALTDLPGVSVLGVGDGSSEDVAVLLETRAHGVLARLGTDYDVVLVHTAPLAESEDAVVLAAGNALLVSVPAGVLRPSELRFLAEQLRELPLRLIGCIHIG